ncbi:DsrE family protein [Rhodopseudomonas palustris]|uniref:DsrE family protein n=1 Tax=Rhodopseudomonas palustris TaxID=1076 RepID=UPI002ACE425B|nr:DsrE family protein [Rhodopseudomonas palustris]WQG99276.1 DsrE family protein [Rhodopseudomonas palustris]
MKLLIGAVAAVAMLSFGVAPGVAAGAKSHRVAIQVDQDDPAVMNLALNNAANIMDAYKAKGEDVEVEVVTYGPGLHMLRDDSSPVKDRIKQIADASFPATIKFTACGNTRSGMEKREGHAIGIIPQASVVPSGAVRLMELQEDGWSYLRP